MKPLRGNRKNDFFYCYVCPNGHINSKPWMRALKNKWFQNIPTITTCFYGTNVMAIILILISIQIKNSYFTFFAKKSCFDVIKLTFLCLMWQQKRRNDG